MKNGELVKDEVRLVGRRGKEVSSHVGVYHHLITMQLAVRYPKRMITVEELTRIQYGRVTGGLVTYVRRRISIALNRLLDEGVLAFIKYEEGGYGRVEGFKVFGGKKDRPMFDRWLERYTKRQEQTDDKLAQIHLLLRRRHVARLSDVT